MPLFKFILGWTMLLSFLSFNFCVVTLRSHIDPGLLKDEANARKSLNSFIPPRELLNPTGLSRYRLAKILLIVSVIFAAVAIAIN